jgi:phosphate transport system permease protein
LFNSNTLSLSRSDVVLVWTLRFLAGIAGVIVFLILAFLLREASPALEMTGLKKFFTDSSWHPSDGLYNMMPMLWGTLFATAGSVLLAAPAGIISAIFCRFYAPPKIAWMYRRLIELLAGIPSVIFGFWGLMVLVPLIGSVRPPGASLLAGILILTMMILPTMAMAADASLSNVPISYLHGATALGFSRWTTITRIVFPSVRPALFTGLILQSGRAIGETMAILMVCGNIVATPESIFDPIRTLTANIALEMAYAMGSHRSALFVSGLLLMAAIVILVAVADLVEKEAVRA